MGVMNPVSYSTEAYESNPMESYESCVTA